MQICGVTNVADAELAVSNGADLIGMIMWPKAKRSVDDSTAAAISACAFFPVLCSTTLVFLSVTYPPYYLGTLWALACLTPRTRQAST